MLATMKPGAVMADMPVQFEDSWMTLHDAGDSVASSGHLGAVISHRRAARSLGE